MPFDTRVEIYAWLSEQLADLLGVPLEDVQTIDENEDLIGYGLDSIRMMYLQERLRTQGLVVEFATLTQDPTISAWLELLAGLETGELVAAPPSPASEHSEPFDLTPVQQAYWLGRNADEILGNISCHAFLEFRGRDIVAERLGAAAEQVRTRHPMLRARFMDGRQQVLEQVAGPCFDHQDWRGLDLAEARLRWEELREWRSHECLDVAQGQVFLLGLAQLPDGSDYVWLSLDLLAADVESLRLLLRDLGLAYADGAVLASAPSLHFADHLARRRGRHDAACAAARSYWLERLPTLPDAPRLPLAQPPEGIRQPRCNRRSFTLSRKESQRLEALAAEQGVTLSSVFGCAFAAVIARWSETPDFLLNVPLFDRHDDDPAIADVIADFTTLLLLECHVDPALCFAEAVKAFQRDLHGAIDKAAFPAIEVLREARRQGEPRSAPVVFSSNLGKEAFIPEAFRRTFGDLHDMVSQTPQVWLDHQLYRVEDGILLAWDAVIGLFPQDMLDSMFAAYVGLIQHLCDGGWEAPAPLPLPWAQQAQRMRQNGEPGPAGDRTLHAGFLAQATSEPDAPALWHHGAAISRGALADRALRMAAGLREAGVNSGDVVEINLARGPDQIAAVFAVLALGGCYLPLDIDQPHMRRQLIEETAGVRLVIGHGDSGAGEPPRYSPETLALALPLAALTPVAPESSAYIIYTSGSTGVPKGVEVSHTAAMNTIEPLIDRLQVRSTDRLLAVSALDFDLSVFDLFGILGSGGSLVVLDQDHARDAAAWAEQIASHGVTLWNSAPALLEMVLSLPPEQTELGSLRTVLLSGDWVALDLPERLRRRCPAACVLHVLGGATEAGIWSNIQTVESVPTRWRSIPYGRPLPGQAYRVVDGFGRDAPDHVAGELWIGGASLARGYRNDPVLTAARFVHDGQGRWYRTGDRGRFWEDGTLEFLGRIDRQVKVRGQRIELGEIESALRALPGVESACAAVLTGEVARIGAALTLAGPEPISEAGDGDLPAVHPFPDLGEAEMAVTREALGHVLERASHIPEALCRRWLDWLANSAPGMDLTQALNHLGWGAEVLKGMGDALASLLDGEHEAVELLLDPRLAPQALAARLPDGAAALERLVDRLAAISPDHPARVAVLDCRAGFWLDGVIAPLLKAGVEVTLLDRSRGLLDTAADRLPQAAVVQSLDDGLLPLDLVGEFDAVVSFASHHVHAGSSEDLTMATALLRPEGRLLLIDILRETPLALLGAAVLSEQPLDICGLPDLLGDMAHAGFAAECLWRSERFALVEGRSRGASTRLAVVQSGLKERLPQPMRPEKLWCLPAFPLNVNGKLDRRRLTQSMSRSAQSPHDGRTSDVPLTDQERMIADSWRTLLKTSVTDGQANFFSMGGDSLLATRLLADMRERFGVAIGMADFYRDPTLGALARLIASRALPVDQIDSRVEEGVL